jgi:hypothetical protein
MAMTGRLMRSRREIGPAAGMADAGDPGHLASTGTIEA